MITLKVAIEFAGLTGEALSRPWRVRPPEDSFLEAGFFDSDRGRK